MKHRLRLTEDVKEMSIEVSLHTLSIQVAKYKNNYMRIMIVNVFLVIALIAMFFILKTGSNSNVINYEVNVQNKYSSWQTELESKEAKLKEKRKSLIQGKRSLNQSSL